MEQILVPLKIKDLPHSERPREKLIAHGVTVLSNAELLAIILRTGTKNENILQLSQRLLAEYGLKSLASIRIGTLQQVAGIGEAKACQIMACFELSRRISAYREEQKTQIKNAADVAAYYLPQLSSLRQEHLIGVYLDTKNRILKEETIFIGTLDSSLIHPREIFHRAVTECAASIILIHNHPSGDPSPSKEDISMTKQIQTAGTIMGIEILDHIIIGDNRYYSFKESGEK